MKKELQNHLKKGVLKTPNSSAFHQIAYYLMSVIDATYITPDLMYVFTDPKMSVQFRKKFSAFVSDVEKKFVGYISPVMASWLVTAGGPKVIKLLFQLTQVAILVQISKNKNNTNILNIDQTKTDILDEAITTQRKELRELVEKDSFKLNNMNAIGEIYNEEISKIEKYIDLKLENLNSFIRSCSEIKTECSSCFEELSDVRNESSLLKDWENYIENKIETADKNWDDSVTKVANQIKTSKSTSEEVMKLYRSKSCTDKTLQYDKNRDVFRPECNVEELQPILNKLIKNDNLYLPFLFEAYNTILKRMNFSRSYDTNDDINNKLNDHRNKLNDIEMKIDEINKLMSNLQQKIKVYE